MAKLIYLTADDISDICIMLANKYEEKGMDIRACEFRHTAGSHDNKFDSKSISGAFSVTLDEYPRFTTIKTPKGDIAIDVKKDGDKLYIESENPNIEVVTNFGVLYAE